MKISVSHTGKIIPDAVRLKIVHFGLGFYRTEIKGCSYFELKNCFNS
jgi:hypothetical protein